MFLHSYFQILAYERSKSYSLTPTSPPHSLLTRPSSGKDLDQPRRTRRRLQANTLTPSSVGPPHPTHTHTEEGLARHTAKLCVRSCLLSTDILINSLVLVAFVMWCWHILVMMSNHPPLRVKLHSKFQVNSFSLSHTHVPIYFPKTKVKWFTWRGLARCPHVFPKRKASPHKGTVSKFMSPQGGLNTPPHAQTQTHSKCCAVWSADEIVLISGL